MQIFTIPGTGAEIIDCLSFRQNKPVHDRTSGRSFSALSFRLDSDDSFRVGGRSIAVETGNIVFVPAGFAYERVSRKMDALVFHFRLFTPAPPDIRVLRVKNPDIYRPLFEEALTLWQLHTAEATYRVYSIFYRILAMLAADGMWVAAKEDLPDRAATYMRERFFQPELTVKAVADGMHISCSSLRRIFSERYGQSPKTYLTDLRIAYAKTLMESGYYTTAVIAERSGFSDAGYFRTVFRTATGMTLREYRATAPYSKEWMAENYDQ